MGQCTSLASNRCTEGCLAAFSVTAAKTSSRKTMADYIDAKKAECIPLHPDLVDSKTGLKKDILPQDRDPLVTQRWIQNMMQGRNSPLYAGFQPAAKGGKMDPRKRKVTFEELLLRQKDNFQSFPIYVTMHLTKPQRYLMKIWEIFLCDERQATHLSQKNFNMLPDDIVEMKHLIAKALQGKTHYVEWQEYKVPTNQKEYPTLIAGLDESHFEAMQTLRAAGVNQTLDDVSVCQGKKPEFNTKGHP